jgi:tetratricopeptide (TPR) repeat protein
MGLPPMTSDWAGQIAALFEEAEATPPGADRAAVLCQIAELQERRMGDPGGALSVLQAALADAPSSGRVIQVLERVGRNNGLWGEVVALAGDVAGMLEDTRAAADLWVQIAFWNETARAQLAEAVAAAEAALALEPAHGGALAMLGNLQRRLRSWDRYVDTLERRRDLSGLDAARQAEGYREVLRYEPRHARALDGLARALEELGEAGEASEVLRRLIEVVPAGGAEQVSARHRLAALLVDRLADPRAGEEQLLLALAAPAGATQVPILLLLAAVYRGRGDWLKARQVLGRAADAAADRLEGAAYLAAAAEICAAHLDDEPQAAELYAAILALDPARDDLAEKLAEIRLRRGDMAGLLPLAERLAAGAEGKPPEERARLLHRLARARLATGDEAGALEAYGAAASEGAPASELARAALADFAGLAFRREEWTTAAAAYARLVEDAEAQPREVRLDVLERLGLARLRAGEPRQAIEPLERAIALDARRPEALRAVVEAAKTAGDDDVVVRHSHSLLAVTEDPRTKLDLLELVATIHRDRRQDPQRAIAAYFEALEIWPGERSVLHRLLELLSETKQWKQAVQILRRLAEVTEAEARATVLSACAAILSDELASPAEAVDALDQALDATPRDPSLFERAHRLAADLPDGKRQERLYRSQIERLAGDRRDEDRPALLALWRGLADVLRVRLKDGPGAIAALEAAVALAPEDVERRRLLAGLYRIAGPASHAHAIEQHQAAVGFAPTAADMEPDLKALVRLWVEKGALDQAHAAAGALVVAGRADAEEKALYHQYRPQLPVRASHTLAETGWQAHLLHPDEDRLLGQILAVVAPPILRARGRTPRELGLAKKLRRDVPKDPSRACRALAQASQLLGVPLPEVFLLPEEPFDLDVVAAQGPLAAVPVIRIGQGMADSRPEAEAAFVAGRTLAWLRADHLLRWPAFVATTAELGAIAAVALRLIDPAAAAPPEPTPHEALLAGALSPQDRERLLALVRRYRASPAAAEDLSVVVARWARGAVLSAVRAGWLACGDVEVASRLGQVFAAGLGLDPGEVTRDLAAFVAGAAAADLRRELGMVTVNLGFRG